MRINFIILIISTGLLFGGFGISPAFAGMTVTYSSNGNGFWNSPGTWLHDDGMGNQIAGVPGTGDDKFISHTVTISSPVSNAGLVQVGGSLIVDSTLTNTGFNDGMTTRGIINFGTTTFTSNAVFNNNGLYENFGGTTTINSGGQFFNNYASGNGHFHNEQGGFFVNGNLTNTGDIHQLTNGIMEVSGTLVNSGVNGIFDNRFGAELRTASLGTINNQASGSINNQGTLNNNLGSINNSATINNQFGTGIINNKVGTLKNNVGGTINNQASNTINNESLGTLDNSGVIENTGTLNNMGVLDNDGTINNKPTGEIENTKTLTNKASGIINNEEIFDTSDNLENEGTINNKKPFGKIENTKTLTNKAGGTINNEDTLENRDKFDNDGTVDNKEDATFTNFDGGTITNNDQLTNNGKITNKDTITNTGTIDNDNYLENEKQIDNTSGTINNTCLINNSGDVPNMGGMINNQNTISNMGMLAFQPGGKFTNSGTLNGNMEVNILTDEIIPEEDKIKGRIVIVAPDRLAAPTDKVGQLPLKGVEMTFFHSGPHVMADSDRMDGNFSFDVPTKKDTVSIETVLEDGASPGFPNGLFEIHHGAVGTPVKFKTENFNSCIRIAFLELSSTDPEFKLSGKDSTPILTGLSQVERLADLAGQYYYSLIAFDFIVQHLQEVTLDDLPLKVVGYSSESVKSNFFRNSDPSIHMGTPYSGTNIAAIATGSHTETQIDVLLHEFGHYITYESDIHGNNNGINTVRTIHPTISNIVSEGCHAGYAQIDSSCAWSEGVASFFAGVIVDKMLMDPNHDKFSTTVLKTRAGDSYFDTTFYDVFGNKRSGMKNWSPLYEEFAVAALLWALYSPSFEPSTSNDINDLMMFFGIPDVRTVSDLYDVMNISGLVTTTNLDKIFGNYKICVDANMNNTCDSSEVHGVTSWENITATVNTTSTLFSYPIPMSVDPRHEPPPYFPSMVSIDIEDLTGNTIMNGTEVTIETILPNNDNLSHTTVVYDGKLNTNFLMTDGSHVNLIFSNDDFFSEQITINAEQYFNGFGNEDQMNSLTFVVEMAPRDPCVPPNSGNWIITTNCELTENTIASGNVTITNNSLMEIPPGITLTIESGNNITIEMGSGLKIILGGTLQVIS
ncbi:MAG: hypothetical protein OEQ12_01150 [Nitrosopumilus sp.]|nr:hypothetical protein [Nitrosopumilus sp.]